MADGDQPPAKRARLGSDDLSKMTKEELIQKCLDQEAQIDTFLGEGNENPVADLQEKYRQLQQETARRENVLVMRLTAKDQELQELVGQNEELKRTQNPSTAQLRGMLLDPSINLMFQRMKKEMEQYKEKLEQAQNDMAAWKFTPDGQTGKRLMAKCRLLLQENSELGKVIASGRTAKLEGEIAVGKKFVDEMKLSQAENDAFLLEMDEDVEGLQTTILLLQQQLKEAKEQIEALQGGRTSNEEDKASNGNSNHVQDDASMEDQHRQSDIAAMDTSEHYTRTTTKGKALPDQPPVYNGMVDGGASNGGNGTTADMEGEEEEV